MNTYAKFLSRLQPTSQRLLHPQQQKQQITPVVIQIKREASTLEYDAPNAYKLHKLEKGPSTHVSCNREEGLEYYKKMQVVRRMEASANNMYKSKLIRGFCHLYSGQVRSIH